LAIFQEDVSSDLGTGTITALNGVVIVPVDGKSTITFNITGTWTATLSFQGSVDGGILYTTIIANLTAQAVTTSTSANDRAIVACAGYTHVRLIATAFTSGTANIDWSAGQGQQLSQVWNTNASSLRTSTNLKDGNGTNVLVGQTTMAASLPVVIATDQENTPVLFNTTFTKTAIGLTELMALLIKNPTASGKTVYLKALTVTNTHTVANSWIRWRLYSNPTISANGTANAAVTARIGSGSTAVTTPFSTPTITANGTLFYDCSVLAGSSIIYPFPNGSQILANNNLLITAIADAVGRVGNVTLAWTEL
jgi:hypothetical protein